MPFQQRRPTLLTPGPVEVDDEVLQSMGHYSESHVSATFVATFGETLSMLRKLFQTDDSASQPFIISGSGTLGWDQVAANLTEARDAALVLHTGYFSDAFADCLETYGVEVRQLKAAVGSRPALKDVECALLEKSYAILTITHVDTSTGVLCDVEQVAQLVRRVSPDTLVVVDGVCSVGCEDLRFDDWNLDVVLTASQKAIGCPPGLSIVMASGRAVERFQSRKSRPPSYYASWKNWLPIMRNYEARKASYFATPSPQLIHALHTSLSQMLSSSLTQRFQSHETASRKVKSAVEALGIEQLAPDPTCRANGLTVMYIPNGITAAQLLECLAQKGFIFAAGFHKDISRPFVRFGHMGVSVMDVDRGDIDGAISALKEALTELRSSGQEMK